MKVWKFAFWFGAMFMVFNMNTDVISADAGFISVVMIILSGTLLFD